MYNALLYLHSLLRWIILLLLVIAIIRSFVGMTGNKPFTNGDKKIGLFLMISAHLTFLVGLYQWFAGHLGYELIKNAGFGAVMKDDVTRFWVIEHPVGMLIAIILITIGRSSSKMNILDVIKHKRTFWYFLITLIVILVTVPWPFREGIARPWIPGMN